MLQTSNFEDDLAGVVSCDWIIEAVAENLDIKRVLLGKVAAHRKPGTLLSTNTSGIPLAEIAAGFEPDIRQHFFGAHFFNPPRYLHLVELIPGPETRPDILAFVSDFCDRRLGKGVVPCKDTPNFIANRIGSFFGSTVQMLTVEQNLTIEEVDALTGPLIGLPKSASYRLMDIVGLDVWAHVTNNLYENESPFNARSLARDCFVMTAVHAGDARSAAKWIGDKTGQGCYKRVGKEKEIHALDWKTMEYHPAAKPRFPVDWKQCGRSRTCTNVLELRCPGRCNSVDRAGNVSVAGAQRSAAVFRVNGTGDLQPHRGNRPRHAVGLCQYAGSL